MRQFIAWDLQNEHGDLGIGSPTDERPPLSVLGNALQATKDTANELISEIAERATGNITIAKLWLDKLHEARGAEDTDLTDDRLPSNIIELFDTGIKRIQAQDATRADLGLKAILLATRTFEGMEFQELRKHLELLPVRPQLDLDPERAMEQILHASKGFLSVGESVFRVISAYHGDFFTYVDENYNEDLFRERTALRSQSGGGIIRSFTTMQGPGRSPMHEESPFVLQDVMESPPLMVESPPTMMDAFPATSRKISSDRIIPHQIFRSDTGFYEISESPSEVDGAPTVSRNNSSDQTVSGRLARTGTGFIVPRQNKREI